MLKQHSQYWDRYWNRQQTGLHSSADLFYLPWLASELKLILPEMSGRAVLELGCGSGQLYTLLNFDKASRYRGIDLSRSMLAEFRRAFPNIDLMLSAAESYLADETYDLIFSNAVVQYLDHQQLNALFDHTAKMLAPRGFVVLSMIPWAALKRTYHAGDVTAPGLSLLTKFRRLLKSSLRDPIGNWFSWRELRRAAQQHELDPFFYGSLTDPYRFHIVMTRLREHSGAPDNFLRSLLASRRR